MRSLFASMSTATLLGVVTGLTFLQYPSQPVVARLGTSLSLTCVVGCRTPQCKVWWARATSSSGAERRFLSVSNRYWLKKGVVYPTYADRNSQLEVHLKLIIQKVTFDHYGIYECQAFENRNVTKRAGPIQLKAPQLNFGRPIPIPTSGAYSASPLATRKCQIPVIHDIKANVSGEVNADGSFCLDVKWRLDPILHKKWCKVSPFELWHTSWSSSRDTPNSDFADSDTSVAKFHWLRHSTLPLKLNTTTICNLNVSHYHELQFRVTSLNKMTTFNSHIYYFGNQTAAMVLQGPRHIRVKHGMNFTIPCEVGGEPGPKAMVVAAITGVHKPGPALYSSQAGVRPDTTFWYNRTVSSKNYPKHYAFTVQCIASNMIVNPPDGVTIKYSMWNTKISINP